MVDGHTATHPAKSTFYNLRDIVDDLKGHLARLHILLKKRMVHGVEGILNIQTEYL